MVFQVHAMVEQTGKHTFFGRTATLLQSVDSLGSLQRVLMRVVTVLLVRPGTCSAQGHTQGQMYLCDSRGTGRDCKAGVVDRADHILLGSTVSACLGYLT